MKVFIVLSALVVLAAATPKVNVASIPDLQEILESIYHPNTDPATAQLLLDMLLEQLGYTKPDIGPAIIDFDPADVAPALPVSPAIPVSPVFPVSPASPAPISPLVQIVVNVQKDDSVAAADAPALGPVNRPYPGGLIQPRV